MRVPHRPKPWMAQLFRPAFYPGTGHAFFWPDTPAFSQAARDDAWARVLALLAG